ncbi:hypothetical protein AXF42_Ash001609 [Apostasia shenzhenica]|uniref:Integrase catalytic domain-containing protein n=1 Tax=Apostasia shenzhenica TaxID=1088818 RepID=A0A2I0AAQ9_9ASPA|nr:hypothetical protein AXF42_Ash001609 [Apostasia shenzhenica]
MVLHSPISGSMTSVAGIRYLKYASVWHPHTNGQAEAANKNILNILKKRLDGAKTRWPEELSGALWAYNTAPSEVTQELPFSLSFRIDAVIPVDLEHFSPKIEVVANFDPEDLQTWMNENDDSRRVDMDLLEQKRQLASLKRLEHKRWVERYFNRKVNPRSFTQGDFLLAATWEFPNLSPIRKAHTSYARLQDLTRTIS